MKTSSIKLSDFSVFESMNLDFSSGINVFIGENGTGKSHLMKLMYSILNSMESEQDKLDCLQNKLKAVFMLDKGIGQLVRSGQKKSEIKLSVDGYTNDVQLTVDDLFSGCLFSCSKRSIFVPSRETFSIFDGFIAAYDDQKLSFDETYYDMCVALSAKPLRGRRAGAIASLLESLTELLGGVVVLDGGRFHVHAKDGMIESNFLSEGLCKIASLSRLIDNGSLMKNGFLFWDEPEASLNPKLVKRIADVLRTLAHGGVQMFIATHDYLLSNELSLAAEYQTKPKAPTRFFVFSREDSGSVSIQAGDTLADLEYNPIVEEFAAHYDRERELFSDFCGG